MYLGIGKQEKRHVIIIISVLLGISFLLAAALCCYMLTRKTVKKYSAEGQRRKPPLVLPYFHVVSFLCSELFVTFLWSRWSYKGPACTEVREVKRSVLRNCHWDSSSLQIIWPWSGNQQLCKQDRFWRFWDSVLWEADRWKGDCSESAYKRFIPREEAVYKWGRVLFSVHLHILIIFTYTTTSTSQ